MVCPGCGAPDDQGCYLYCPETKPKVSQPLTMIRVEDHWEIEDEFKCVWGIYRTGDPVLPFQFIKLRYTF